MNDRQKDDEIDKKDNGDNKIEKRNSKNTAKVKSTDEEGKTEGSDLEEKKAGDDTHVAKQTPTPSFPLQQQPQEQKPCSMSFESDHSNAYGTSIGSREDPPQRFGIIKGEGSIWVEWLVNSSRGGSVSVGAMTAAAAEDPDAR